MYNPPDLKKEGLYDPEYEHDNCGVGFVANIKGQKVHTIIKQGLRVLKNLVHRGAIGGDLKTGDGAGILTQLPDAFMRKVCGKEKFELPEAGKYGVGMYFIPMDETRSKRAVEIITDSIKDNGGTLLGLRGVPVNPGSLGPIAVEHIPHILQVFASFGDKSGDDLERRLYVARKVSEHTAAAEGMDAIQFYCCSFSSRTIVYKGLLNPDQMQEFYPDLADEEFVSALALVHQRYSTNTHPSWPLAQPFRFLAHNGEINTLRGNINKMRAREHSMRSDLFGDDLEKVCPVIESAGSDSACFDNMFELLVNGGRSMAHSAMMMVPEAFGVKYHMSEDKRAFYEFHSSFMEPWDGPAALVFTDGRRIGATLDRNGLRPARFTITRDGFIVLGSECGVIEIEPGRILKRGRLQPGKMMVVDTEAGRIMDDVELKASVSRRKPYRHWLNKHKIELKGLFGETVCAEPDHDTLVTTQKIFGYTKENIEDVLIPMASNGQEPTDSMGADGSLAVLSERPQLLFDYFKQLFAQVTNPPIDPIREGLVMSLMSFVGREHNLLDETPYHCHKLKLPHPILTNADLKRIKEGKDEIFRSEVIPAIFQANGGEDALERGLQEMFARASEAIHGGASTVILSDRGVNKEIAPIPILLAATGLHSHLIQEDIRDMAGIIVETGEARDVMHIALLIGYGVNAVNPYLAFETLASLKSGGALAELDIDTAADKYITAVKKGLLKIFSKMGISTLRSYRSAQIFEAVGLNKELVDKYFTNTVSRIQGIGLKEIQEETLQRHCLAFVKSRFSGTLEIGGAHRIRVKSENHLWTPTTISNLQRSCRENDYQLYRVYADEINKQAGKLNTLRGLFSFKKGNSIPLDQVEPASEIVTRFATGAMSYGSISKETHEALAIAMNKLGGKSNTGEGGEEVERFTPGADDTSSRSAIKQVASGRFGVTTEYMVNADELQIKMAQGAKPGEGGQLPGHKVNKIIAKVRHSTPGVTLISPPPHHDIYSIEDLAQLIFDLHNTNPKARVSVKLVSEVGVGTVAAGVAKAKSDMVLISGHDGGTGASPRSSILSAGLPWELGLAETQQTLVNNKLRDKIRVQVDGQMKTGRDVVVGCLLGAEEFGFATAPLVTQGCVMMRKCHKNTCPVGVATQDPELRKKFNGGWSNLYNYMMFVAEEIRELMAELGFKTMDEMVGRADMLETNEALLHWKARGLDFSSIFHTGHFNKKTALRCTIGQQHDFSNLLDKKLIQLCKPALENKEKVQLRMPIKNRHRTCGAMLAGEIALRYGGDGLPAETIDVTFDGSAGQSFGAFMSPGMSFRLHGEANDYMGKGMSGGQIVVRLPEKMDIISQDNIIVGNTLLYGATGGEVFINGMTGERFCVRNSGATAVVEGVGDHGCEYMTGGTVVVLGKTGRNFAGGMSGGVAYVLDDNQLFDTLCNLDMVDIEPVIIEEDQEALKNLVTRHVELTGSRYAEGILNNWSEYLPRFVKVMPIEYRRALARQRLDEESDTDTVVVTEEVFSRNG